MIGSGIAATTDPVKVGFVDMEQVLATVDRIELQLRRDLDGQNTGQIRSGDSLPVPSGYQGAVAEYFRRLSNKNTP